jgi:transitional endoplasmic reticulum ATPase
MTHSDETIESLQRALQVSPENVPLRQCLAQALLAIGRLDEAEQQYRRALAMAPNNADLKVELASLYSQQGKESQAIVIVEDLVKRPGAPAKTYVLYARLLFRAGQVADAVARYKQGIEIDPDVADEELAERLGVVPEDQAEEVFEGRVRQSYQPSASEPSSEIERPRITFRDVGGMDDLKEEIRMKIIYPMQHPQMYEAYGKPIGGGIMMYGPPGCGKTYIARATAGEIQAGFLAVGINDVLEMWIGNSERNLHQLFDHARRNRPCVLFFDEVDALGSRRTDVASGSGRQVINQFLAELDGVEHSNEGVLILAATNAPWHVDPAFRRPGRFDRVLFVPPPDASARAAILRIHCQGKPISEIDFEYLGSKLAEFSGADLKAVLDVAIEKKLREAIRTGTPQPLTTKDLRAAAKTLRPTTREWFASARNYALYSNQGGMYDDILKYLKL